MGISELHVYHHRSVETVPLRRVGGGGGGGLSETSICLYIYGLVQTEPLCQRGISEVHMYHHRPA